jgi:type I restriction enzyme S subunit
LAIGIDNVLDGKFSFGRQHRISQQKYEMLKKYTARPLDVLVTVMATVGRCCVVPADMETAIITKHVYRITTNQTIVNPHFLMHCIRGCSAVLAQVQDEIQGATRPGINGTILKEIRIPLPPLTEQKEIVRRAEALFKIADQSEERYRKAKDHVDRLTQSLLAKAFRGELVPQDPNDEPASTLLERVRQEGKIR